MLLRQGSNERDSSSPPERSSPVILSAAKDLTAGRDRPFPFAALSAAKGKHLPGLPPHSSKNAEFYPTHFGTWE